MKHCNVNKVYLYLTVFLIIVVGVSKVQATHNRAGEILIDQIGDLTIEATIVTYTKASSEEADRDSLTIRWGDGTSSVVLRSNGNGNGVLLGNDNKLNLYVATHTYSGRSTYKISMTDRNRNGGILNVNPPNSINVPFHIETTYSFLSPQFQGYNDSPELLQPPIDFGCEGELFIHNPNAFDPDGDSLSYELIVPKQGLNSDVPNYSFPDQINPGPDNMVSLDPETGDFVWDSPQRIGEYNIAMYIHEYRGGVRINSTIRDLQILIRSCDNSPPAVDAVKELCVIAGTNIVEPVVVTDPDMSEQQVKLEGYGGPFELEANPAQLDVDRSYMDQPLEATFTWQTDCNNIRNVFYSVIFRAVDDFYENTGLSFLHNLRIKVIGPPPTNLSTERSGDNMVLRWDSDYICRDTRNDYFRGFVVWRRNGCEPLTIDSCNSSLEALGYEPIAFGVNDIVDGNYEFTDFDIDSGTPYCYRVTAQFALLTPAGNEYNQVESIPSNESCLEVLNNAPILKKVSVVSTLTNDGEVNVIWRRPLAEKLDTIANPGPYRYVIERSVDQAAPNWQQIPGAEYTVENFSDPIDTSFIDRSLNTESNAYIYRIAFYTDGNFSEPFNYSAPASTIFAQIVSSDRQNRLSWDFNVPWVNYKYRIYKRGPEQSEFTLIDSTSNTRFTDFGLTNGKEYCYYIESIGDYCSDKISDSLVNLSQIICGIPIDTIPPCPPAISIDNLCNEFNPGQNPAEFINTITWRYPNNGCFQSEDLRSFNIYYSPDSIDFELIATVGFDEQYMIEHDPDFGVAGCYYITALDSIGNESMPSPILCEVNCPEYELPNTFTPNGDGSNDLLVPRKSQFIERVDFKLYNQWGNLIYETEDPQILWDGTKNGNELDEGTYFYRCIVYDSSLGNDVIFSTLEGYIELIR